jgi:AcrR family transcriptional regulator
MTDKKDHIINAAVDLFAKKGFEGTSVRDVATAADVNIAMINYYFGSKEKLFETMLERKSSYTRGILDEISHNTSLSEIEKIDAIVESYVSRLFTGRTFHRVIHQEMMLNEREALQQTIVDILYPNSLIIKNIIEGGIKKGVFKKVDAALTIATLIGTINHVLLSRRMCNKMINKEENYIPYDDAKFKKRVTDHIKEVMHEHLLATPASSKK